MTPKLPVVEVEWLDARAQGGWRSPDEYKQDAKPILCRSVGYLLSKDRERIVLMQSLNGNGSVADSLAIPRSWATKITRMSKP